MLAFKASSLFSIMFSIFAIVYSMVKYEFVMRDIFSIRYQEGNLSLALSTLMRLMIRPQILQKSFSRS